MTALCCACARNRLLPETIQGESVWPGHSMRWCEAAETDFVSRDGRCPLLLMPSLGECSVVNYIKSWISLLLLWTREIIISDKLIYVAL